MNLSRRLLLLSGSALTVDIGLFRASAFAEGSPRGADPRFADASVANGRGSNCSPDNAAHAGLRGEYFGQDGLQGRLLLARADRIIDFDGALDFGSENIGDRPRSARWSGWIKAPVAGSYSFHLDAQESAVYVSRQLVGGSVVDKAVPVSMEAGRFYPILLQVFRLPLAAGRRLRLEWTAPFGSRYVVPAPLLQLPTETVGRTVGRTRVP